MAVIEQVWFDSLRPPPQGWYWAASYAVAQAAFSAGAVAEASLDYAVGYQVQEGDPVTGIPGVTPTNTDPNGLDLLEWISANKLWPTHSIACHSSDTPHRQLMVDYIGLNGIYNASQPASIACGGSFGYVEATLFVAQPTPWVQSAIVPL